MSKMRKTPDLEALDRFAARAKVVSEPVQRVSTQKERKVTQQKVVQTAFYFFEEDKERLAVAVDAVNRLSSKKISASLLLRALIVMAEKAAPEDILTVVKEISF